MWLGITHRWAWRRPCPPCLWRWSSSPSLLHRSGPGSPAPWPESPDLPCTPVNKPRSWHTPDLSLDGGVSGRQGWPCCLCHRRRWGHCHHGTPCPRPCGQDPPTSGDMMHRFNHTRFSHLYTVVCTSALGIMTWQMASQSRYLRKGTIVPDVALVRKDVSHVSQLAFLHVLCYGVQGFLCADLSTFRHTHKRAGGWGWT